MVEHYWSPHHEEPRNWCIKFAPRSHRGGEAYPSMNKRCIIIGVGISTTPARLALINSDVNDGNYIILVGSNSDAINALVEFTRT